MTTDSATAIIYHWASAADQGVLIFSDRCGEIVSYLQAVDEIQRTIDSADSEDERQEVESVIGIAMSQLSREFRNILKSNSVSDSSPNSNSYNDSTTMRDSASSNYEIYEVDYIDHNTLTPNVVNDLRSIAVPMNSSGFFTNV